MRALFVIAVVLLSACYNPDLSKVRYTCTQAQPQCPAGQSCYEGQCVDPNNPGQHPDAGGDGGAGLADLGRVSGCASGKGAQVGAQAWACPGTYNPGGVRKLCASGFQICKRADGIDLAACMQVSGFFIADVRGSDDNLDCDRGFRVFCDFKRGDQRPLWFGCGSAQQKVQACKQGCSGFRQAQNSLLAMRDMPVTFTDSGGPDIEEQKNTEPMDGVLCCTD